MKRKSAVRSVALSAACLMMAPAALLAKVPDSNLLKAVPEDVFFLTYKPATPEDDFIEEKWANIWQQVQDSGVINEAFGTIASMAGQDAQGMSAIGDQVRATLGSVSWATLNDREYLFAMRLDERSFQMTESEGGDTTISGGSPQMVSIFRGSEADKNFEAFMGIAQQLVGMTGGELTLSSTPTQVGKFATYDIAPAAAPELAILSLGHAGDTIAISIMGQELFEQILTQSGNSITASQRFQGAFSALPDAETELVFFDVQEFAKGIDQLIGVVDEQLANELNANDAQEYAMVKSIVERLLTEFRSVDYMAKVGYIDGKKQIASSVMSTRPNSDTVLMRVMNSAQPLKDPLQYVPANAANFSASAGVDPMVVFKEIRGILGEYSPEALQQMDGALQSLPINIEQDLLSWIGGGFYSISMPSAGTSSAAMMMRVKDEAAARQGVSKILDTLNMLASGNGAGTITQSPSTLGDEFQKVYHPQMAMAMISPVMGVKDGFLFIGTNEQSLQNVLNSKSGQAETMQGSAKLGETLPDPNSQVLSVAWKDLSNFGQETQMALGMMSMMGGLAAADPNAPPQIGKLLSLLNKVAPIIGQINFLESESSLRTREGNLFKETKVTTYK